MRVQHTIIMVTVVLTVGLCQPSIAQKQDGAIDRPMVPNELLLTGIGASNNITVFEYVDGSYQAAWSNTTTGVDYYYPGGEAGDLTGDGVPEIVLESRPIASFNPMLEVWAFDEVAQGWYQLWVSAPSDHHLYIGDILDFDNDGINELLVTDRAGGFLNLYSYNGSTFEVEATVAICGPGNAYFFATGGDLDSDGTPEIIFQCYYWEDLKVYEYDQQTSTYPIVAVVVPPIGYGGIQMIVDDMETGDVNGTGGVDAVFCGNSGSVHVLTYNSVSETYEVEFNSPPPVDPMSFSQTCSVGDMTNDGQEDILVVNAEGSKVYSFDGVNYQEVWAGDRPTTLPGIGVSFVGDADNDGFTEFIFLEQYDYRLYEDDVVGAHDFFNTISIQAAHNYSGTMIIGNLNPTNDALVFADGFESGDTLAWTLTTP